MKTLSQSAIMIAASLFAFACQNVGDQATREQALSECPQDDLIAAVNSSFSATTMETTIALVPSEKGRVFDFLEVSIDDELSVLLEIEPDQDFVQELIAAGETELYVAFEPGAIPTFLARDLNQEVVERPWSELGSSLVGEGFSWCGNRKLVFDTILTTKFGPIHAHFGVTKVIPKWLMWLIETVLKSMWESEMCNFGAKCNEGKDCIIAVDAKAVTLQFPGKCKLVGQGLLSRCACILDGSWKIK